MNKQKIKGDDWERLVVELLNKHVANSVWKKIPASGAMGTTLGEPLLTGDVKGDIEGFYKKVKAECKAGYNSSTNKEVKQFTLKKEWLDKIGEEAKALNALPVLFGKFSGARSGVKHFVVLDLNFFIEILNEYTELKQDFDKLFVFLEEAKKRGYMDTTKTSTQTSTPPRQ